MYSPTYHRACTYIINHDPFKLTSPRNARIRGVIAKAIWELRHAHGRARATRERAHLRQIAGRFPVKDGHLSYRTRV